MNYFTSKPEIVFKLNKYKLLEKYFEEKSFNENDSKIDEKVEAMIGEEEKIKRNSEEEKNEVMKFLPKENKKSGYYILYSPMTFDISPEKKFTLDLGINVSTPQNYRCIVSSIQNDIQEKNVIVAESVIISTGASAQYLGLESEKRLLNFSKKFDTKQILPNSFSKLC